MATQWARPSGDLTDGNWLNQASSNVNLYASVDEGVSSISDADYIRSGATPSADQVLLSLSAIYPPDAGTAQLSVRGYWGTLVAGSEVAFVWAEVSSATSYVLQVGPSTGSYTLYNADVGNVLTYPITLGPGTYYSRVVPQGAGSPTAEQTVTVT